MTTTSPASCEATIRDLVRAFETCTLPRERWNHAAHLTVALWYLKHYGRPEATRLMREGIQRYNGQIGSRVAYHETITLAWLAIIQRFLQHADRGQPIAELTAAMTAALSNKHMLYFFYSHERLMSEAARHGWLPPDLQPIDNEKTRTATVRVANSGG